MKSSSSKVTTSRLLWVLAQSAYPPNVFLTQVSPSGMLPSCMLWYWSPWTKVTVGSFA